MLQDEINKQEKKTSISTKVKALFSGKNYYSLIIVILFVWFIFQALTGGMFLTSRNLGTLLLQTSILGFVTLGMIIVMVTRGIDLSAGSVIAVLSAIGAVLNIKYGVSSYLVLLIMFIAAMVLASWQGFLVAKLAIPAFIVTLAGQLYLKGTALIISNGQEYAPVDPIINGLSVKWLATVPSIILVIILFAINILFMIRSNLKARELGIPYKTVGQFVRSTIPNLFLLAAMIYICSLKGLPWLVVILLIVAIVLIIIMEFTPFGRHIYAVGANPIAAQLSGVNPKRITFLAFIIMGFAYFFSSVGMMSRISGFVPGVAPLMELDAVAAAVIGGTSLFGGYGTIIGGILGALLLTSIDNGMSLLNVPTFYQYTIKGFILLLAVIIDVTARKRRG